MFQKLFHIFHFSLLLVVVLLFLIFPFVSFRFHLNSEIFPAVEIIVIYYFYSLKLIKNWQILIISVFLEQLYLFPTGVMAFSFLLANIITDFASQWLLVSNYIINSVFFYIYAAIVFLVRCSLLFLIFNQQIFIIAVLFQYLTTIFLYPAFSFILDYLLNYLQIHVR